MKDEKIQGYTYGTDKVARSPLSLEDLDLLKKSLMFSRDDERYLHMAGEVLADQVESILDVWYDFMGSYPHLMEPFSGPDGLPNTEYLVAVRRRFGRWIEDTCNRPYDRDWLDYQQEIALRHYRTKKNQTDHVQSTPIVPLRYIQALIYPIMATIKPFLAKKGHSVDDVNRMHQAWSKSVVLQVTLWTLPYVGEADF